MMIEDEINEVAEVQNTVDEVENIVDEIEPDVVGDTDETTELDDPPEKTKEEIAQEKVDKRISEFNVRAKSAENRAAQAEAEIKRRNDAIAQAQAEREAAFTVPPMPELPDEYATEEERSAYSRKVQEHVDASREQERIKIQQDMRVEEARRFKEAQKKSDDEKFYANYDKYAAKGQSAGIDKDALVAHEKAALSVFSQSFVENFIMIHPKGALVMEFIGENKDDVVQKIAGMNALQGSAYIEREIVPKLKTKPKKLPPERNLGGGNAPSGNKSRRSQREGRTPY